MAKKDEAPIITEPIPEETLSERQEIFLAYIEGGARYNEAAAETGVHRVTAWRWKADPDFMKRYRAARKCSVARLKEEAEWPVPSSMDTQLS